MRLYVGTSGYGYKGWKGPFYPLDLTAKEMLRFYAEKLPSVEINTTFYGMPRPGVLEGWAEQVPADFRFALKAPRKITHIQPLKDKEEKVEYLLKTAAVLGGKLGAILFQLPPHLQKEKELLRDFVDLLPPGAKASFEFRHPSWFDDDIYEVLQRKGCTLCYSDAGDEELSQLVATADWGYLRLRRETYREAELLDLALKVKAQEWREAFVFFKHEEKAIGPELARHFLDLASISKLQLPNGRGSEILP